MTRLTFAILVALMSVDLLLDSLSSFCGIQMHFLNTAGGQDRLLTFEWENNHCFESPAMHQSVNNHQHAFLVFIWAQSPVSLYYILLILDQW